MQVQVQGVAKVGAGPVKGAHLADHGQDDGERRAGAVKRDVEDLGAVDEAVNLLEGVVTLVLVS